MRARIFGIVIGIFVCAGFACCCLAAEVGYRALDLWDQYLMIGKQTAIASSTDDFIVSTSGRILWDDGSVLCNLYEGYKKDYTSYIDIPEVLVNAFVAIEDREFFKHDGVNWKSTAKVTLQEFTGKGTGRGASTITQQLVKNMYLTPDKSYVRKMKEIAIALALEEKYSKEQIFEFYVNNINYANSCYSAVAAARKYFSKDLQELTVDEAACLAAIPNNPSAYNPLTNYDNLIKRRNLVLGCMYEEGYLSADEFMTNLRKKTRIRVWDSSEGLDKSNYVESYAKHCLVEEIMELHGFQFQFKFDSDKELRKYEKKYDKAYSDAEQFIYCNNVVATISIDKELQTRVQGAIDEVLGGRDLNGAVTVIDNKNGFVKAIVGGKTYQNYEGYTTLNRAYQSRRQPGSCIKPIVVYTPAIDVLGYTPDTIVNDYPMKDGPDNSGGSYLGRITLRTAVEKSKNVVAWQLFDELTPQKGLTYLRSMRFRKLTPKDDNLAVSLGGFSYGVTTVEMASAYETLANRGVYREPTCIKSITIDGEPVTFCRASTRVYSAAACDSMTDILTGVSTRGTAAGLSLSNGMPIACKTGTTNNQRSGWFCGFTPYYSCACYVGYDDNSVCTDLWGSTYPLKIWERAMNAANEGLPVVQFTNVEQKTTSAVVTDVHDEVDNTQDVLELNENSEIMPEEGVEESEVDTEQDDDLDGDMVVDLTDDEEVYEEWEDDDEAVWLDEDLDEIPAEEFSDEENSEEEISEETDDEEIVNVESDNDETDVGEIDEYN